MNRRELGIKNCKNCKGAPKKVEFNIGDFKGERCEYCFEVVTYEKIKDETRNTKSKS
jgi:hypothetical protein